MQLDYVKNCNFISIEYRFVKKINILRLKSFNYYNWYCDYILIQTIISKTIVNNNIFISDFYIKTLEL